MSRGRKIINLIGRRFGKLVVKEFHHQDHKRHACWTCICDCGKEKIIVARHLKDHGTISCGCHSRKQSNHYRWNGYEEISGDYWRRINYRAQIDEIYFNITIEYIWSLFIQQNRKCALSGVELKFNTINKSYDGNASLDRIDSSKGYIVENLQWVHKDVNYMKQEQSDQEFINWCAKISDYQRSKNLRD